MQWLKTWIYHYRVPIFESLLKVKNMKVLLTP